MTDNTQTENFQFYTLLLFTEVWSGLNLEPF